MSFTQFCKIVMFVTGITTMVIELCLRGTAFSCAAVLFTSDLIKMTEEQRKEKERHEF